MGLVTGRRIAGALAWGMAAALALSLTASIGLGRYAAARPAAPLRRPSSPQALNPEVASPPHTRNRLQSGLRPASLPLHRPSAPTSPSAPSSPLPLRPGVGRRSRGVAVSPLAGVRVAGSTIRVTRASFAHYTGPGLGEVLQSAMATPQLVAGRIAGFQLSHLKPGSLWAVLGFRDGDVVTAINELPLTDPLAAIAQLQGLREARKVGIRLRRGVATLRKTILVD